MLVGVYLLRKKRKEKKRKTWIYNLLIALLSPQSKAQEEIERQRQAGK